jgi:hypothetical protein
VIVLWWKHPVVAGRELEVFRGAFETEVEADVGSGWFELRHFFFEVVLCLYFW